MTKLCPFRKAAAPPDFDPTDGSWYWVTDTAYGGSFTEATGNGSTDDRAALQSCINAAASAGKGVYFPAGTYYMVASSGYGLSIPSNITLRGEGATSNLKIYDDGTDDHSILLSILSKTNVTVKNLKLMGTQSNKEASVQIIRADGTSYLTLDTVTFDGGEYALRTTGSGESTWASNITVTNCTTLGNVLNPFFLAYAEEIHVSGCNLEANRVDCATEAGGYPSNRWPHHFYVSDNVDGLYVSDCTLSGGQHVAITVGGDSYNCTNLYFSNIIFDDVVGAIHASGVTGIYHFDGVTMQSDRYWWDYSMATLDGVDDFLLKNFSFAPQASNADYLTEMWDHGAGDVIFEDGSMTNCHGTALSNTPIGAIVRSGQPPIYRNVSINGSIYNYGE